ncbi:putative solute-binding protein family 3/ domain of MltF [Helianthus annuus]|uniref:glutamate receptor 2.5 isoform X2 n=1 Tax=Helianthus annuus TaxID=4232 RepID=UPI000B8F0C4B|nr:glutamate receptor 2.5 isoform X2 [Helianthus annuus]KAJ0599351.1 putative solute-binding protein family 3/ domain of MltF [Helianthus annuus]KAJ0934328.1 putative solute-binding protein family 3/ domain of MltF [Helianthus annuus]
MCFIKYKSSDIIGQEWNMNKSRKSPCPTLVVWVPKKTGFTEFVEVNEDNEVQGGFSVAIFCKAVQFLPFNVRPIFRPFINETGGMNGTYDDLLRHIEGQKCQAVAGDVTIRGNRAQYVSFTIPYLAAEIYMLVHATPEWIQTLGTFLKPFTTRLWITLVCACILTGIAVALLEYRADNPKFESPFYKQLLMVIWFPISTFFFHEGEIRNKCTKVVLVMWLCMIFIVLQIFTATLSSWLTLDQLRPRVPSDHEKIGYQGGSFIKDLIIQKYKCSGKHLQALNSYREFKNALDNGSVDGIVDHLYYIDLFLAKYPSEYTKVGPIHQEAGIAFALPIGSALLEDFSRAVINVTESEFMEAMKTKYLGLPIPSKSKSNRAQAPLPQSLDVKCFIGLFTFMGIVTIAAIILSEVSLRRRGNKVGIEEEECKQQATASEQVQIKIPD